MLAIDPTYWLLVPVGVLIAIAYTSTGISGATQHWVGAMGSKNILAINTDPEANMVTKAGWAVIADLHEMVPAITEEVRKRRA